MAENIVIFSAQPKQLQKSVFPNVTIAGQLFQRLRIHYRDEMSEVQFPGWSNLTGIQTVRYCCNVSSKEVTLPLSK